VLEHDDVRLNPPKTKKSVGQRVVELWNWGGGAHPLHNVEPVGEAFVLFCHFRQLWLLRLAEVGGKLRTILILLLKLTMSFIFEKHVIVLESFLASLKILICCVIAALHYTSVLQT